MPCSAGVRARALGDDGSSSATSILLQATIRSMFATPFSGRHGLSRDWQLHHTKVPAVGAKFCKPRNYSRL